MRTRIFCCVCIFGFLLLGISNGAMAHGKPVITLASDTVKAGGQMTIKGTKMHPGVVYNIILESMEGSTPLGRAKVNKDGGFTAQFTLSANVAAGSHKVRAVGKEGESTLLNLTVLPRPQTANENPVQMMTNSGSQVQIERKNSAVQADSSMIERPVQSLPVSDAEVLMGKMKADAPSSGSTTKSMPMAMSPSNHELQLDRRKTPFEANSSIALALTSVLLGAMLIRKRISKAQKVS